MTEQQLIDTMDAVITRYLATLEGMAARARGELT